MTLDEMKLAVCGKLPELIHVDFESKIAGNLNANRTWYFYWKNRQAETQIHWPTEGLQVCHEAEKKLELTDWQAYIMRLGGGCCECQGWSAPYEALTATYEQRFEALCRVWFPERFTE